MSCVLLPLRRHHINYSQACVRDICIPIEVIEPSIDITHFNNFLSLGTIPC